jgi:hypothetical protein
MKHLKIKRFVISPLFEPRAKSHVSSARVSSETSFVSKQPKLEPKLVSALSETRRFARNPFQKQQLAASRFSKGFHAKNLGDLSTNRKRGIALSIL